MEPIIERSRLFFARQLTLLLPLSLFLFSGIDSAARAQAETSAVTAMEPVVVTGTVESDASGISFLGQEQISALPAGDGNVGDLIKLLPAVQTADTDNRSFRGGDILPPLLSISGGLPYDNHYQVDGLGNNSLLDPVEDNPHLIDRLPGHPEAIFLNSRLVGKVSVYDNNVPARYGGFTGGFIDVETIDPSPEFSAGVHYRTTRDAWTQFHIDPADQTAFEESRNYFRHPHFTKHVGGLDFSIPVTLESGLLFSYQFTYSEIPLLFLDTKRDQSRINENYMLKFVHQNESEKISLQAIFSPYEGEYFTRDSLNSDFSIAGGGRSFSASYEKESRFGLLEFVAGVRESANSRKAPKDYFSWTNSASKDWGALVGSSTSKEGGFGSIEMTQETTEAAVDFTSRGMGSGAGRHVVSAGLKWSSTSAHYDRDLTSYSYRTSIFPPPAIACGTDTVACLPGEQYLSKRSVYGESHAKAEIDQVAAYVEDVFTYRRLKLRGGLRVSHDDLMGNSDVAPRLSATFDVFGNGRTRLVGGANRYFGGTLLTYKLREGIALSETEERTTVIDNNVEWVTTNIALASAQYSGLKTPYVDEAVLGTDVQLLGGEAGFRYVRRKGHDEFAKERDPFVSGVVRYTRLNNNGKSHYESCRLSWERRWLNHYLGFNLSRNQSYRTHDDYDETLELSDLDDLVWYEGDLLYPDELPSNDFNRHRTATLTYSAKLPFGVTFTNVAQYRDGYKNIEDSGIDENVGGTFYDVYREYNRPSTTIFNWKIDWTPLFITHSGLTVSVEIFNLFNKKAHVGSAVDEYELGRQFWLGSEYRF